LVIPKINPWIISGYQAIRLSERNINCFVKQYKIFILLFSLLFSGLSFSQNASSNWKKDGNIVTPGDFLGSANNEALHFKTNNQSRMVISGMGSISFPAFSQAGTGILRFNNSGEISPLIFPNDPNQVLTGAGTFSSISQLGGWTISYGGMYNTSLGNVGIGTQNPTEKLHVDGNLLVTGTTITSRIVVSDLVRSDTMVVGKGKFSENLDIGTSPGTGPEKLKLDGDGMISGTLTANEFVSTQKIITPRIVPAPGDSLIRFGDSTFMINPTLNRIWADQNGIAKGIGISGGTALGSFSTAIGRAGAPGDNCFAAGNWISSFMNNTFTIGLGISQTQRLVNTIHNSLMIGFNSTVPTLFVGPSSGPGTTGIVCIGTTDIPNGSQYKLVVKGTIIAEEIEVKLRGDWPDYVFDATYPLLSFEELRAFIKANKHLPGVPSASEMKEKGISVSETITLLQKQNEELTLYVLQLEERLKKLEGK
jgi:hypothetical protein